MIAGEEDDIPDDLPQSATHPAAPAGGCFGPNKQGSGRDARKGFIQRIPRTHRYELTTEGRRLAVFFTKTYTRIVNPALVELDPTLPAEIAKRSPLATSYRAFERAIDERIKQAATAA